MLQVLFTLVWNLDLLHRQEMALAVLSCLASTWKISVLVCGLPVSISDISVIFRLIF